MFIIQIFEKTVHEAVRLVTVNEIKSSNLFYLKIVGDRFPAGPPKKHIFSMQLVFFMFLRKSLETNYV